MLIGSFSGFDLRSVHNSFADPDSRISDLPNLNLPPFAVKTETGYGYIQFLSILRIHSQEGGISCCLSDRMRKRLGKGLLEKECFAAQDENRAGSKPSLTSPCQTSQLRGTENDRICNMNDYELCSRQSLDSS